MRTRLPLALFAVLFALARADYELSEVPGVYRWRRGSPGCEGDLVVRRTVGTQISGSLIRGTQFTCSGGLIDLTRGRETRNDLTKFLADAAPSIGQFIIGEVTEQIDCQRRDGKRFSFEKGQLWNFVEPRRDTQVDFSRLFGPRSKFSFTNPNYILRRGREYLFINDECLYQKSWYVCFPASGKVTLESGAVKRMDEIVVGDRVAVGNGQFSDVFMWTHKEMTEELSPFVRIETASGAKLTLTAGHYLRVSGKLMPAEQAAVGETVQLADGTHSQIVRTSNVQERGFFNPQTLHGDIVVDGVVTTTYTDAIAPTKAHAMLAPLRLLYKLIAAVRPLGSGDARQEL